MATQALFHKRQRMEKPGSMLEETKSLKTVLTFLPALVIILTLFVFLAETRSQDHHESETGKKAGLCGDIAIVFKKGLLSVTLKNADLEEVLKEIARQCGVRIEYYHPLKERITVRFSNIPLERGMKRLLGKQSYCFIYTKRVDTGNKGDLYDLTQVKLVEKSGPGQKGNRVISLSPGAHEVEKSFFDQGINTETPTDLIEDFFSQEPQLQEKALQALAETITSNLEEVREKLLKATDESAENGNAEMEAVEMLLREGGEK